MALITLAEALAALQKTADDSFDTVQTLVNEVDAQIKTYCSRSFELGTYKERLPSADGLSFLLREMPVTEVLSLTIGTTKVMEVTNTSGVKTGTATVAVDETGLILRRNGAVVSGTLTFAANVTVNDLATAVNGLGGGWSATVESGYAAYPSSLLLARPALPVIGSVTCDISAPGTELDSYQIDYKTGELTLTPSFFNRAAWLADIDVEYYHELWRKGILDIDITYRAGYAIVPNDVKSAALKLVSLYYDRTASGAVGLKSYSIGGISKTYEGASGAEWPNDVTTTLDRYKAVSI